MTAKQLEKTERWVKRLNKMAREMDDTARAMHPSAWRETLAPQRRAYEALARKGEGK